MLPPAKYACACCGIDCAESDFDYGHRGEKICPECAEHQLRQIPRILQDFDDLHRILRLAENRLRPESNS